MACLVPHGIAVGLFACVDHDVQVGLNVQDDSNGQVGLDVLVGLNEMAPQGQTVFDGVTYYQGS